MRLRREASIGIASILGLQIILSTLAIALLMRMGPAIDHILEENVSSEAAVEQMLASLARTPTPSPIPDDFENALTRAKNNVTQDGEQELVNQVEALKVKAFNGIPEARQDIIQKLRDIGNSNRNAMDVANSNAKGLGEAGAWAAALLGTMSLIFGIFAYRRLLIRIEHPIENIIHTFSRLHAGNHQARCTINDAPGEIQLIGKELNWVVDEWQKTSHRKAFTFDSDNNHVIPQRLICALVDKYEHPLKIKDQKGNILTANKLALELDDSIGWVEKPLLQTEYFFLVPPEEPQPKEDTQDPNYQDPS